MPKCLKCQQDMEQVDVITTESAYSTYVCGNCAPDMVEMYKKRSDKAMEERLTRMGIPRKYHNATLNAGLYDKDCLQFKKGMVWFGESGAGKTWQMVGMIREAIKANKKVAYGDWTNIMCELRCNPNEYKRILTIPEVDIMAIDDFEVDNGFTFNYVYDFIKRLYCAEKIVYMTCSVLPAQDKIAMRLGEMTSQYEVKLYDGTH